MTRPDSRETIESILGMYKDRSVQLADLDLTPASPRTVRPGLEPDDLRLGAIGRDPSVQVLRSEASRSPGGRQDIATAGFS